MRFIMSMGELLIRVVASCLRGREPEISSIESEYFRGEITKSDSQLSIQNSRHCWAGHSWFSPSHSVRLGVKQMAKLCPFIWLTLQLFDISDKNRRIICR